MSNQTWTSDADIFGDASDLYEMDAAPAPTQQTPTQHENMRPNTPPNQPKQPFDNPKITPAERKYCPHCGVKL